MRRLFLLLFCVAGIHAQSDFQFSGYALALSSLQQGLPGASGNSSGLFSAGLMRLRLRPIWFVSDNLRIVWEHEANIFYSSETQTAQPNLAADRQLADLRWSVVRDDHVRVVHFIDRAYIRHDAGRLTTTIGRQRIAWGTGRIWNPTDLFNPVNPADFGKIEKDGADALSLKWTIGNFTDFQTVVLPQETMKESHAGVRFRSNTGETDWSVMTGYFDRRTVFGTDAAGNLADAGVRAEVAFFSKRETRRMDFYRAVAGVDYQFTPKMYGLLEYFFNGSGKSNKENYNPGELFRGGNFQLGRHYLNTHVSYLVHPLLTSSLSSNVNMQDRSGFVQWSADFSAMSWMQVGAGVISFYGGSGTEYDLFYSDAYYVRATIFF